jgi:hypothetical protein
MMNNPHTLNLIHLIFNRITGSMLFLALLSVWFFLLGTFQGYGETNLILLLIITRNISILGLVLYLLELSLGLLLLLIKQVKKKNQMRSLVKSSVGIIICTVLSFGTTIYYQLLFL